MQCTSIHSSLRLIYMWPVNTGRASIFSMIWQIFSHKLHWKYLPWDIAWQDRQTQWCPGGRQWISSVGYWGQGSGSEHQSSAWCVWCCCRCGPSWRDDAALRCPAACSRGWQRPGSQPGVPRAWLFLPGGNGRNQWNRAHRHTKGELSNCFLSCGALHRQDKKTLLGSKPWLIC